MNVSTFRGKLVNDGARPNLFEVTITDITSVWNGTGLQYFAKASQIPGQTIGIVPVTYMGRQIKLAGNRTFADFTMTVINDEGYEIRSHLENWMHGINGMIDNERTTGQLPDSYTSTVTVKQINKNGSDGRQYKLFEAWPTDISPITLDWGDNDTVQEYTATF